MDAVIDLIEREARALAQARGGAVRGRARRCSRWCRRWPMAPTRLRPRSRWRAGSSFRRSCRSSGRIMRSDFEPGGRARLGEYLAKAKCVLELPGARSDAGRCLSAGGAGDGGALRRADRGVGRRCCARAGRDRRRGPAGVGAGDAGGPCSARSDGADDDPVERVRPDDSHRQRAAARRGGRSTRSRSSGCWR